MKYLLNYSSSLFRNLLYYLYKEEGGVSKTMILQASLYQILSELNFIYEQYTHARLRHLTSV